MFQRKKTLKLKEHHTTIYTLFAEYNMTSNKYRKVGKFKHPFARKETNQNVWKHTNQGLNWVFATRFFRYGVNLLFYCGTIQDSLRRSWSSDLVTIVTLWPYISGQSHTFSVQLLTQKSLTIIIQHKTQNVTYFLRVKLVNNELLQLNWTNPK